MPLSYRDIGKICGLITESGRISFDTRLHGMYVLKTLKSYSDVSFDEKSNLIMIGNDVLARVDCYGIYFFRGTRRVFTANVYKCITHISVDCSIHTDMRDAFWFTRKHCWYRKRYFVIADKMMTCHSFIETPVLNVM